jgi:hypothetical protein
MTIKEGPLASLLEEIIYIIFSFLLTESLKKVCLVNKKIRELARSLIHEQERVIVVFKRL